MSAGLKRLLRCRRGTAAVEFALILPVFLALTLGVVEFGYQTWLRVSLDFALAQTARCVALGYVDGADGIDCSSLGGAQTHFETLAQGVPFNTGALTLSQPSTGCLSYSYQTTWLVAGIMPVGAPTWSNTSCYYF